MEGLLIFDLDGTLIDSRKDIAASLNHALASEGFPILEQKKIEELVGWGAKQLVVEALGNPPKEDLERVFLAFWKHYGEHCLDRTTLYPDALRFLESTSHWHKALVTNKPEGFTRKILQGLKIGHHFSWTIGGDTLPVQKPDPKVFAPILENLPPETKTWIIGDSIVDIQSGQAAGWPTIALSHGFGNREELEAAGADYLLNDFNELTRLELFKIK